MRSNFLVLLPILFVLGTNLLQVDAKTLTLNSTKTLKYCPAGGSAYCDFMAAEFWIPAEAPANGDDLRIQASANLELFTNLELASLIINSTTPATLNVIIKVNATMNVTASDANFVEGAFTLTNGYLQVQGTNYTFGGSLMFDEFYVKNMYLDNAVATGNSLTTSQLNMIPHSSLTCRTLMTQLLAAWTITCKNVILVNKGPGSGPAGASFVQESFVTTMLITGPIDYVVVESTLILGAMFFTGPDAKLGLLGVSQGKLTSENSLIFNNVAQIELDQATLTAPYLTINDAILYATASKIVGDLTFYTGFIYPDDELHIYGSATFSPSTILTLQVDHDSGTKAGALDYGKIIVHGQVLQAQFELVFQMSYFIYPAPQYFPIITYESSNTSDFNVQAFPGTLMAYNSTAISFLWTFEDGLPINCTNNGTPVMTPSASQAPSHSPMTNGSPSRGSLAPNHETLPDHFSTLNIVLMVACAALAILSIALGVALAKKKNAYEPIQ